MGFCTVLAPVSAQATKTRQGTMIQGARQLGACVYIHAVFSCPEPHLQWRAAFAQQVPHKLIMNLHSTQRQNKVTASGARYCQEDIVCCLAHDSLHTQAPGQCVGGGGGMAGALAKKWHRPWGAWRGQTMVHQTRVACCEEHSCAASSCGCHTSRIHGLCTCLHGERFSAARLPIGNNGRVVASHSTSHQSTCCSCIHFCRR
jgi:hypothetical protein